MSKSHAERTNFICIADRPPAMSWKIGCKRNESSPNLAAIAHDPDVGNGVMFSKVPVFVRSQSPESHQLKELFEPLGIVSEV
jgi:hypothetical protein